MVAHAFTRPALPMPPHGAPCSTRGRICRRLLRWMISSHGRPAIRRLWRMRSKPRLNPLFVEWLMGWPPGHALSRSSETAFTLWRRDMRSALSALPSASGPWIWTPAPDIEAPEQLSLFG